MGYYTRILGTSNPDIHIDELISSLDTKDLVAKFEFATGDTPDNWSILRVRNADDKAIIQIERNAVVEGELGQEELNEFKEDIGHYKPASAVAWLNKYFDKITVIYAFQMLDAAWQENGFSIATAIKETIWNQTAGIFQSDNEGFSNENGYHILWQFSEDVDGEWNMAVINELGEWTNFNMDLVDQQQRESFWLGKVPQNARIIGYN